jgi:hypothetical protein
MPNEAAFLPVDDYAKVCLPHSDFNALTLERIAPCDSDVYPHELNIGADGKLSLTDPAQAIGRAR